MTSNFVGLNVGGKVYMTARTTLTRYPDSFFDVLLNNMLGSAKDDRGNYLIDRDGELFRHILNFLRNDKLMLPEGFNEFSLLERETDFFQLSTMKRQLHLYCVASENIGLNVGGKIYQTTRKTLTREPSSYFAALLSGESPHARDAQGNFLIDRDGILFRHVLNYLTSCHIQPVGDLAQLALLLQEAEYFDLRTLREHIVVVRELHRNPQDIMINVYLFYFECGICTIYTNREGLTPANKTSWLPLSSDDFHTICGPVRGVSFALDKARAGNSVRAKLGRIVNPMLRYPANKGDLIDSITSRLNLSTENGRQISNNCTIYKIRL